MEIALLFLNFPYCKNLKKNDYYLKKKEIPGVRHLV